MTVELGRLKRGDDKQFRDIVVTVAGAPQDLTAEGWEVAVQLRVSAQSNRDPIEPTVDPSALADSIVRLSLPRAMTEAMEPRTYVGDIEVTGPGGRQSSEMFTVVVEADVTR